jgi:hypothetical protein
MNHTGFRPLYCTLKEGLILSKRLKARIRNRNRNTTVLETISEKSFGGTQ